MWFTLLLIHSLRMAAHNVTWQVRRTRQIWTITARIDAWKIGAYFLLVRRISTSQLTEIVCILYFEDPNDIQIFSKLKGSFLYIRYSLKLYRKDESIFSLKLKRKIKKYVCVQRVDFFLVPDAAGIKSQIVQLTQ